MAMALQVLYPAGEGTTFDHDYYLGTHMPIVNRDIGPHVQSVVVTKGLAGGPDVPPPMHAVATMVFEDQSALDAGLAAAGAAIADLPNFYSGAPQMLIGEVIA